MKNNSKINVVLVFIFFSVLSIHASAQQAFSGTWALKERTMLSGNNYANAIVNTIKITTTADSISMVRTSLGQGQDGTTSQTVSTNGKPTIYRTKSNRKVSAVITMTADKQGFTITAIFSKPDNDNEPDYQFAEIWAVSTDGKLTIIRSFQSFVNADDKWSVKGVFEKQ